MQILARMVMVHMVLDNHQEMVQMGDKRVSDAEPACRDFVMDALQLIVMGVPSGGEVEVVDVECSQVDLHLV